MRGGAQAGTSDVGGPEKHPSVGVGQTWLCPRPSSARPHLPLFCHLPSWGGALG